jgi:predicted cobalt transporter CbtA
MTGGDIAGLIAAGVFAVLVAIIAVPLIKLGKVFDETTLAIRDVSKGVAPILEESTTTIQEANKQLARVDAITTNVAEVTGNVNSLVALFAASLGGPLIKLASFSGAVRAAILGARAFDDDASDRADRSMRNATAKPKREKSEAKKASKASRAEY